MQSYSQILRLSDSTVVDPIIVDIVGTQSVKCDVADYLYYHHNCYAVQLGTGSQILA